MESAQAKPSMRGVPGCVNLTSHRRKYGDDDGSVIVSDVCVEVSAALVLGHSELC